MPNTLSREYRLVERRGPGARVVLQSDTADRSGLIVLGGFRGPTLPAALGNPHIESRGGDDWHLASAQGSFDFEARAVDRIEVRPALYHELHRGFALTRGDRLAVRCLLALLRLPGGARLLRFWHARRRH